MEFGADYLVRFIAGFLLAWFVVMGLVVVGFALFGSWQRGKRP